MSTNTKTWWPHIIALALFIIVPIIYFLPALEGKALFQSDISHFLGVVKEITDFRAKYHTEPLWTNSMFGGMPAFQVSMECHANLVTYIYKILCTWMPFPANMVFLYCLGFYILLKALEIDTWVSILGAFAFAFSSFFFIIISVGHNSQANAIAFMAPTLAGVILALKGKRITGSILMGVSLALELLSDHLQITYYLLMIIGVYTLIQLFVSFKQKQLPSFFKAIAMLAIAAVIALGTNITSIWLTYEYGKYSTRGTADLSVEKQKESSGLDKNYALAWSYGVPETMTLLIPNFQGGASQPIGESSKSILDGVDSQYREPVQMFEEYWGSQSFTAGPVYVGAIICFFALLGFFVIKGPMKWFLLFTSILSIMLAWGKNFLPLTDIFFNYLPGYNKFRAVSMILVIAEFTLPLMAALALDRLVKSKDFFKEKIPVRFFNNANGMKIFIAALCLTCGIALLCYVMPTAFTSFQKQDEISQLASRIKQSQPTATDQQISSYLNDTYPSVLKARKEIFTADAMRTMIFIILAGGLVWVYVKKMINEKIFVGVLLFFILMDMYNVDKRYLNDRNFTTKKAVKVPYEPDAADMAILQDTSQDYRVFNTTAAPDQDSRTSYFHKSLGGYSGIKMRRYHELLDQIEMGNMSVIDMLNAKYFIVGGKDGQRMAQKNPGALGNAWFIDNFRVVPNADSERTALSHFDPMHTAVVDAVFTDYVKGVQPKRDSTDFIKLNSYLPNDLVYTSKTSSPQFAVFSEIYYKDGWDAFIDGKPTDYIRVNYILRAMAIPAGTHTIEFKFEPKEFAIGEKVSLASSLLLIVGCVFLLFQQFRPKKAQE
ncbi:MAG TPA: YfhO family protein [Bacteroidia bacterium]|nr:YfhO family protein [Bacteroidia bacterium]